VVGEHYGIPTSLIAASLALSVSGLLGRILPMPTTDQDNLEPVPDRPDDESRRPSLDLDSGPVVASIEYRIASRDVGAFLSAANSLRRMRRRNGARRWALLHDAFDPEIWIERFETPTWLDHLRVHDRMTIADREVDARIAAFHGGDGPPVSRYLLAHMPIAPAAGHGADPNDQRSMVFDPSLPPSLAAKPS
jgi:hypothetical protein